MQITGGGCALLNPLFTPKHDVKHSFFTRLPRFVLTPHTDPAESERKFLCCVVAMLSDVDVFTANFPTQTPLKCHSREGTSTC